MTSPLRPSRASARRNAGRRALALSATSAAAATGLGVLAAASARRDTVPADEAVRERTAIPSEHPVRRTAVAIAPIGKWWAYIPAALGIAAYVLTAPATPRRGIRRRREHRRAGACTVAAAGALAAVLAPAFDRWLPQPPAPPGHDDRRKPVFPSGHTFGPGAVALTAAYVLAREQLAPPGAALPVALAVPLVAAGGKLLDEKHWPSDVAGGYLAATAVAAACLAAYEVAGRP